MTIDKAAYGVKESSKAIELLTKLKDTSVKLSGAGNNTAYTGINVTFLYILYWYHRML
jgi:hypothetical protein